VGRKRDLRDVERVAKRFGMDPDTRREFGDFLEQSKRSGDRGSRNNRGDYTWPELNGLSLTLRLKNFLGILMTNTKARAK
jgi:hypothetical protein